MSLWKDINNMIHDDMNGEALSLPSWPQGLTQITQIEADTIYQSKIIPLTYKQLRAAEYPPLEDYLDGIIKGDQAQIQTYINACLAVKSKYPKQ